ncbi:unnamed protein product [Anisakis simplex]|uniref:Huntingtin interacting protein 1 (inferred by orthology to a D. melanogaster protein) n=1 Tax=Anisakis simplex TaxID=6269 RepID=A0A0M3KAL1_ANISI|nr:unnamed protein product [Anisakis simplex]
MTSRRAALTGADREAFIKAQIMSVHKALNKNEVPLKQKHVRVLIVGTHKEKSSSVFWNTVNRIQLEKNPVLTWKFCHLLHKNPVFPGSLQLPEAQINKLVNADVNHSFELSIEMLDQMDDLLNLQTTGEFIFCYR